jgi:transcriptional regulator with XRE-family HTH domain
MPPLKSRYGPPPAEVAARIKAERVRLGLSQEECARRLGVTRTSYRQLEETANPQLSRVIALVELLGMDGRTLAPELTHGTHGKRAK